jgi:hypothetical protein
MMQTAKGLSATMDSAKVSCTSFKEYIEKCASKVFNLVISAHGFGKGSR